MTENLCFILAELRNKFETLYGTRLAQLLLSYDKKRCNTGEGLDIDVFIVLKGAILPEREMDRTFDDLVSISLRYDEVAFRVFLSEEGCETQSNPLFRNVRHEVVLA